MNHLIIKPAEGRLVRDPQTKKPLNPSGERKPRTSYWTRRLRAGDVIEVKAEAKPVEKGENP